jgi:uncharacterized protein YeaO (DUF488 family)
MIKLKRVYESPSPTDGLRILVDRLWPRGLTKERAAVDLWVKDVAPSTELRKWFGHDPAKWKQFQIRYRKELQEKKEALKDLKQKSKGHTITLVYGAVHMPLHAIHKVFSLPAGALPHGHSTRSLG